MTMLEILAKTRALIAAGWTQWAFARDDKGFQCDVYDEHAKSFCLTGAICRAAPIAKRQQVYALLWRYRTRCAMLSLTGWNDHPDRTQEDVLRLLDAAIEKLKKKGEKS